MRLKWCRVGRGHSLIYVVRFIGDGTHGRKLCKVSALYVFIGTGLVVSFALEGYGKGVRSG